MSTESIKLKSKKDKVAKFKIQTENRIADQSITVASILKTVSDPMSLELFKSISADGNTSPSLRHRSSLTRRQYYSRLSNFAKNGMLIKENGKTYRSSLGRIVYHVLMMIENALINYYKLKAIDSIGLYRDIPQEEHKKIIETLITDPDIKQILYSNVVQNIIKNAA